MKIEIHSRIVQNRQLSTERRNVCKFDISCKNSGLREHYRSVYCAKTKTYVKNYIIGITIVTFYIKLYNVYFLSNGMHVWLLVNVY